MAFVTAADRARMRREFIRLVKSSDAATTMALTRLKQKSGSGIEPGLDEITVAPSVYVLAEQVHSVTREGSEVTLAGRSKAGNWNVMAPQYADVQWDSARTAAEREYRIDDLIELASGEKLKILAEPVDGIGHFEFVAGDRNE